MSSWIRVNLRHASPCCVRSGPCQVRSVSSRGRVVSCHDGPGSMPGGLCRVRSRRVTVSMSCWRHPECSLRNTGILRVAAAWGGLSRVWIVFGWILVHGSGPQGFLKIQRHSAQLCFGRLLSTASIVEERSTTVMQRAHYLSMLGGAY